MKNSFIASLMMVGLVLTAVDSAFATASVSNVTSVAISADTAGTGGSGAYTTLSGPILTEGANRDIGTGAIVLNTPSGFAYNPAAAVSVTVTRVTGTTGALVTLSSGAATVTTTNITITVSAQDQSATSARSILTWSGIQARPTVGTPLSTNNITKASGGATISGITAGSTSFGTLSETVGAANKLAYTTAPAATNIAGVALTNVVIQVQDRFGNIVSSNNVAVALALNTGAFASGNTNANTGAGGSATFSNLIVNAAGNYTLTASAAATSLSNSPPSAFTVVPTAPNTIQITQDAPSSITAGATFPSAVTVQLTDPFGNLVSNKTVTLSLLSGATLSGTTSQPSGGNGVATFNGLSVAQAGSQSLVATTTNSLSVTGATFTVTAGSASQLGYAIAPAAVTTAGVTMASIVVRIQDLAGNSIASNGVPITVTLNTGGFTTGTATIPTAPDGSATFSDLLINTSGNYTLTASATGTTFTPTAAAPFTIAPATPSVIQITQDAPAVTNAGAVFSPAVTVLVTDSLNNPITNKLVTLSLNGGGPLNGSTSHVTVVNGVASFTNLNITVAGANYSLVAAISNPSLSVTGNTFVVTTAAASKLVYASVPATTNVAGSTLSSFTVQITDPFGNSIPTNGVQLTMSLSTGAFASGTTTTNTDSNGSATISDLVITNAGNNTLTASAAGLTSANTALVILPTAYAITFQQDAPSPAIAGVTFAPPVAVRIADQYNNVLSNRTVTLSLLNGGTLNGITSRTTTNNGVATFTNLTINVVGTNYALVASSTNSLSVTGNTFVVTTAAATKLLYTVLPPATSVAGATLTPFTVQIADQFNNSIATNGVLITMSLTNGAFASGTTSSNSDVNGSATFSDLVITNAGNNTLIASSIGLTSTNRAITITPDVTNSTLAFVQGPAANITAGVVFTNTVKIVDEFNNGVSNATVTLSPNGFAVLNGITSRATAGNGVATFTNLSVNTAGSNYFITATSGSLSNNSSSFNVIAGGIHHYLVSAATPQTRGVPFPVTVTAQDVVSNTVPDSSTVVTMSGSTPNVQFDSDGDSIFDDNTQTLSNGTFVISTLDDFGESITITAKDASNRTGSVSVVVNAAGGDYRSFQTGPWNTATTWQIWDGTNWDAASIPPAGGSGTNITVQSTHTVTNNTIIGLTGTLITQGSLTFSAGGSITVGSGGLVLNSGAVTNSSTSTLIFSSGGTYQHNFTTAAGTIPTATWNAGATCAIVGYTTSANSPAGLAQSFNNFVWNCPNQSVPISAAGSLATVNGDFTIASTGSGSFQGGSNAVLNLTVGGNMNLQGGAFIGSVAGNTNLLKISGSYIQTGGTFSQGSGLLTLNFTGVNKNFIRSGGTINYVDMSFAVTNGASLTLSNSLSVSNGQSFTVFNTGTLNCGANVVSGAGTFSLNSGGALGIGSTSGITSSGATGNVQTTFRTFSTGGVYIYNGSASQATGNGLPATASSLVVSNTGGIVTLGSNVSVTSNLTVSAGVFDLGSFTANRASSGGTVTVANSAALKIGGTNPFPTNYSNSVLTGSTVEYEGSAQNVASLAYGNLNTSGSGIKTLLAGPTSLAGDLNIGAGTTFNAVTNSFSITGNLTNNGTAFTFSGPQTVTFNGSSTQNVAGASSIAFNTFAIGSASVINLGNNDTALEFTIAGLDQAGGTWGATGSGAVNTNDTNFVGTGTLDVTPPTFGISFTQDAPAVTNAGAVFSPPVTVQLTSSATNLIVNKMVTLSLNGGGPLNGPLSQLTDVNGVATFTNLIVNVAGNYSLTATIANPALSVTGNVFTVTAAASTKLVYTSVPSITNTAGGTLTSFTVQIQDQFNNNVPSSGVPITMSLASGTFASGTTSSNSDVNGSASFSDLVITNAGNNTLTASSLGLTSANRSLVILPASYAITFQQDAPAVTNAGSLFSPPVAVRIADAFNNVLANRPVTLSLLGGGPLLGTLVRTTAVNGVSSFNDLNIRVPGTNYALVASSTNSLSVTGNTFVVTTAPASKLLYTVLPPSTSVAGGTLTPFTLQIADQFNNSIATNGVPITMSLSSDTFAGGTITTNSDLNGSASFNDLVITNAGNNTLIASSIGLTSTNRAIIITPDVANSTLAFVQGPAANITAGALFTNTVKIVDEFNNGVSNATVTLSPNGFATLNGVLSRATAGTGVATFTNLSVNTAGSNYFITATSGSLSTNSSLFNVIAGGIHHYLVSAATPQTRGTAFNVTVTAQDVVSNTVPDSSTVVTMSGSTANVLFDADVDNTFDDNTQTLSNGTFTISTKDNLAETITITASDANGKTGTSPAIVINAAAGDYRSFQTGPWNTAGTWQIWDGASWVTASTPPAGGANTNITILSTHTVTNNTVISLTGTLITQGSLTFSAGGSITVGSGGLAVNSGAITNSSVSTLIFGAGSTYEHNFTTAAGTIPIATWNANSTCEVIGYTTLDNSGGTPFIGGFNQAFANLTWNCLSQSGTVTAQGSLTTVNGNFTLASSGTGFVRLGNNGVGDLAVAGNYSQTGGRLQITAGTSRTMTVAGNFSLSGGTFDLTAGSASGKLNVAGNFSHTGGTLTESQASSPVANVVFNGTGVQTYTSGGTVSGTVNFNVSNNATLFMGTNLLGSGSAGAFTLSTNATLGIGDSLGIALTGASGNIRVSGARTYSTGANYIYNGSVSQVTSNGLPAIVRNLTISNTAATVTLGANVIVSSNLTVSAGTFDLGAFTANRVSSGGGTITVANGAALKIGGTNPFPARYANLNLGASGTVEYEGSSQSVTNASYGSLATSGSGTKTLQTGATTIASNLTIGAGTTFDAGTNSFSIAGNWSNNGNGFTATNAQTVTFNGSSPQTIDGSFATAFNNVAINSGSVLNLAINGCTAQLLSIGGTNQLAGTWGTFASGATHPDDTDFQGSGTLNVLSALTVPSTTALATSGSPSTYGQSVTFTATVTGTGPTPSGTVTFMAGANTLGTQALSGSPTGTAAVVTSGLFPGSYTIAAVYSGDANFFASSNSVAQQVNSGSLTVTANSTIKTYGQTVSFAGTEFTTSGTLVSGDSVTSVTLTSDGAAAGAAAGNHSIIPSAAVGVGLTNYTISYQNGTLTVNQEPVTGSITASNKVYDGTTAATISSYSLSGVVGLDNVTLTGGTANFSDRNVGNGKTVTATGLTLAGSTAGNYALTSSNASTTANITNALLAVHADDKSRPFGQLNPPLTASYSGFGSGDNTNVLSGAPDLTTTAGTNSPVASYPIFITAGSLSAANYSFTFTNGTLTVTKAILTVTADDQSRPYGATNPVFTATYSGFMNGDTNTVVSGTPDFSTTADTNSPVAGNPYSITVTNGTLIATNYDFAFVNGQLLITPATVSGSITASNKVYDGTTAATISSYALSGVVATDDVTLTGGTANFIDQNVGIGKLVTVTGLTLSGTTTGNYALASSTTNTTADITAYPLTVTATTNTKPYDGSTSAAALPSVTVGTLQNTDTATFSEAYDTKNVGIGKTLTPTATINDGNGGANYFVTYVSDTTGVITSLTLTGSITASNKVYDGTITATISSYSLSGVIGLEDVSLTGGTANFIDKNVGTGKSVTANGLTLSGTAAGNYAVNTTASTLADITPAPLTIFADNKTKTAGLPNPTLTATYVGFISGDDTNALTTPVTLSTTAIDSSPAGLYPITVSGAVAANYTISYTDGTLTVVEVPQITNTKVSGNQFIFSFQTLLHEGYQVEYKDDLGAPTWTPLGSLIDGTGNSVTVTNPITGSKRFYRVEVSPQN